MLLVAGQPLRHALDHGTQKGKRGPRRSLVVEPASQSGGGGYAIGIFERRGGVFPGTAFNEAQPHGLAARHQTVMGIGQGESRKEADCYATDLAFTAAVADPVVTVVVRLLRAPAEALDGACPT